MSEIRQKIKDLMTASSIYKVELSCLIAVAGKTMQPYKGYFGALRFWFAEVRREKGPLICAASEITAS
jgi:hypothetical protein